MLQLQSLFWGIPSLVLALPLTIIAVLPAIPEAIGYGICWAVPFLWAAGWGFFSTKLIQRDLRREKTEWASGGSDVELAVAKAEVTAAAKAESRTESNTEATTEATTEAKTEAKTEANGKANPV